MSNDEWVYPLEKPIITSPYSLTRKHPVTKEVRPHYGVDYRASVGTAAFSISNGQVRRIYTSVTGGRTIEVMYGDLIARYLHMSNILVKKDDIVQTGQLIGYTGDSGRVSAAHLHFEMSKYGQYFDPTPFLADKTEKDWFEMATKKELQEAIYEELNSPEFINKVAEATRDKVWAGSFVGRGANRRSMSQVLMDNWNRLTKK